MICSNIFDYPRRDDSLLGALGPTRRCKRPRRSRKTYYQVDIIYELMIAPDRPETRRIIRLIFCV